MLRADLAAQRRQLSLGGPAAFVVVPGRGRPGSRDAGRTGEARVQEREHEASSRPEQGVGAGQGPIQIIDVGQAEVAGHHVEGRSLQARVPLRRADVGVQVPHSERIRPLSLERLADQRRGDVGAGHVGPAPGKLPGDPAVPAGQIQDPQASPGLGQVEQRRGGRVVDGAERRGVEISHRIVAGLRHGPPASPGPRRRRSRGPRRARRPGAATAPHPGSGPASGPSP